MSARVTGRHDRFTTKPDTSSGRPAGPPSRSSARSGEDGLKNGPSVWRTVEASPSWHAGVAARSLWAKANSGSASAAAAPMRWRRVSMWGIGASLLQKHARWLGSPPPTRSVVGRGQGWGALKMPEHKRKSPHPAPPAFAGVATLPLRGRDDSQTRLDPHEHLLDRGLRGGKARRIARAHHDIGVGPARVIEERIAADAGSRMGLGDRGKLGADVALARVGTHRHGQHFRAGLELGRHVV